MIASTHDKKLVVDERESGSSTTSSVRGCALA
jgi:hypothetical protein